jgi:S-adenosylmethionine hydrolase
MPRSIITLTSDFGLKDPYVAEMKAVILSISPDVTIVDVTHEIEKFNIRMGAFVLASAVPYFPKNAIHVAVVDPGVGTRRRTLLVQMPQGFLIGPDNGILALAAKRQGMKAVHEITNRKLMMPNVSSTFHGRDIFAPAAAHLANGTPPAKFGSRIPRIVSPQFAKIIKRKDTLVGEVIHVDGFGNIITNIGKNDLEPLNIKNTVKVTLGNTELKLKFCKTYAEAEIGSPIALIGSHDFLEIALNQGNAAKRLKTEIGDTTALCRP